MTKPKPLTPEQASKLRWKLGGITHPSRADAKLRNFDKPTDEDAQQIAERVG